VKRMTPMDEAWMILKMPMRGTSAEHFDQSMQQGMFEPRQGTGGMAGQTAVWAAPDESQSSQDTVMDYAMSGYERGKYDRAPLVHYIPDTVDSVKQGANYAVRYPEGVKAEDTQEIWRGQSYNDWKKNSNLLQRLGEIAGFHTYYQSQIKDFERALENFRQKHELS